MQLCGELCVQLCTACFFAIQPAFSQGAHLVVAIFRAIDKKGNTPPLAPGHKRVQHSGPREPRGHGE